MNIQRVQDGVALIDLGDVDLSKLASHLADAWPLVADEVSSLLRARPTWEWDRLRAYACFNAGIVWFSPDPEVPIRNANVAGIKIAQMRARWYELPPSEDEVAFERAHAELDREIFDALRESALLPGPRASLMALQRLRPHAMTFVQYDDLETERTLLAPEE